MLKHLPIRKLILSCGDALLLIASFYISYAIRVGEFVDVITKYTGATIMSLFIFLFSFYVADIYHLEGKFYKINNILRIAITIIIANCLIAVAFYFFHPWRYSRIVFLLNLLFTFSFMISWRFVFEVFSKYGEKPSRILIVGAGNAGKALCVILDKNESFEIVGYLDDNEKKRGMTIGSSTVIGDTSILQSLVKDKDIDEVVIAITHTKSPALFKRIMGTKFEGVEIYDMPRFYEKVSGKIPILHISDRWIGYTEFYGIRNNVYNTKTKIVVDKIIAVLGIIASFPLMLPAITAIKIESKGPVFFKQKRVGENAIIFDMFKLRTMKSSKENTGTVAGFESEMIITRVGKILRLFRIDEIPQLWNVINGDMSLVGPRSLIKEEVDYFAEKVPYFLLRYSVKPGVTGWAQVNYKHGNKIEDATEKLQYDLYYIKNLSPILDMHILLKTTKVMLFGKGAR